MSTLPKYNQKLSLEENIAAVRDVLELKFTSEYETWSNIVKNLNKHMREYVEGYNEDPSKLVPYTYNEFCASYMHYVVKYIREKSSDYDLSETVNLISIMATDRLPKNMVLAIAQKQLDKAQEQYELAAQEAEETGLSMDKLRVINEEDLHGTFTKPSIPLAWRVELDLVSGFDFELEEGEDDKDPGGWSGNTYRDDSSPYTGQDDEDDHDE